jgi:hypothetical protein
MAPSATFSAQPAVAALLADYEVSADKVRERFGAYQNRVWNALAEQAERGAAPVPGG